MTDEGSANRLAGGQVPHPHRAVDGAGDGDGPPVQNSARHGCHLVGVAGQRVAQGRGHGRAGGAQGDPVPRAGPGVEGGEEGRVVVPGGVQGQDLAAAGRGRGAVGADGAAVDRCGKSGGSGLRGVQVRDEAVGVRVDEVVGVGEGGVEDLAQGGVGGQVAQGVGVRAGPVGGAVGAVRDVVGQGAGDGRVDCGVVGAVAQVFSECLVVEAVRGAVVLDGLDDVGTGLLPEPGDVRVGVVTAADAAGQRRPQVLPGQALALGVGEGAEQVGRAGGVRSQPDGQVLGHRLVGVPGQALVPPGVVDIGEVGQSGQRTCGQAGHQERAARCTRDPAGDVSRDDGCAAAVGRGAVGLQEVADGVGQDGLGVGVAVGVEVDLFLARQAQAG